MTHPNPIITTVAREAAATDWPLSGVTVIAPLVAGAALLTITWAHFEAAPHDIDTPAGVSVAVMARAPNSITPLPAMVDTEGMVVAAAWAHGAWDVKRTAIPAGYDGPLPPPMEAMADAARAQGYVAWYWRPMMRGPEIRAKQKRPDLTLDKWTLGRDGPPPEIRRHPLIAGREVTIRLGDDGSRRAPAWLATDRQRAYLVRLLQDAGEDDTLPDDLDKRSASAWIDRLTGQVPPEPSRKARKRRHMITANQYRLIDHYIRRLGGPGLPVKALLEMTYAEAERMRAELQAKLA